MPHSEPAPTKESATLPRRGRSKSGSSAEKTLHPSPRPFHLGKNNRYAGVLLIRFPALGPRLPRRKLLGLGRTGQRRGGRISARDHLRNHVEVTRPDKALM